MCAERGTNQPPGGGTLRRVRLGRRSTQDNVVTDLSARIGSRLEVEPTSAPGAVAPSAPADPAVEPGAVLAPEPVMLTPRDAPAPTAREDRPAPAEPELRFTPPGPGEIDLVVAPLPFADDRHQFENAIRRLPGVVETSGLYHRRGVYRMRVVYRGDGRLSQQIRALRGFRVRVLAEDRKLVQALIEPDTLAPA
jgi:hypothetical protein